MTMESLFAKPELGRLHVHGPGDIARFLRATREIAKTTPTEKA